MDIPGIRCLTCIHIKVCSLKPTLLMYEIMAKEMGISLHCPNYIDISRLRPEKGQKKMTLHEKVVLSAYTGILMCDFSEVHKYIEKLLGRPVWTHELASEALWSEIKEKAKPDFHKIIEP